MQQCCFYSFLRTTRLRYDAVHFVRHILLLIFHTFFLSPWRKLFKVRVFSTLIFSLVFVSLFIYLSIIFVYWKKRSLQRCEVIYSDSFFRCIIFSQFRNDSVLWKDEEKLLWFLIILTFSCNSLKSFSCTADCILKFISIAIYFYTK